MSMIVKMVTPARYMAMAAPERMLEWVQSLSALKPSSSSPMVWATAQSLFNNILDVSRNSFPSFLLTVHTGVLGPVPL